MSEKPKTIEECRKIWAKVAKENRWYREPFYIQVWLKPDGSINDSIYLQADATEDIIINMTEQQIRCSECDGDDCEDCECVKCNSKECSKCEYAE